MKNNVEEACTIFINNCKDIQDEKVITLSTLKRELYDFKKKLTKFNEDYRQFVLGMNPKAKVPAITVGTYVVSLKDLIYNEFNQYITLDNKLQYTEQTLKTCIIYELALVYACLFVTSTSRRD